MTVVLHDYWRSSASYRVRIALALKGVDYDYAALHLRKGDQRSDAFLALNPQGLVPALEWGDGQILTQSLAIIEYLDEIIPQPPLLPSDPAGRARVRSLADMIALDIHPINNLRVLAYLKNHFGADDEATAEWFRHWVSEALPRWRRGWPEIRRPAPSATATAWGWPISALPPRSPTMRALGWT